MNVRHGCRQPRLLSRISKSGGLLRSNKELSFIWNVIVGVYDSRTSMICWGNTKPLFKNNLTTLKSDPIHYLHLLLLAVCLRICLSKCINLKLFVVYQVFVESPKLTALLPRMSLNHSFSWQLVATSWNGLRGTVRTDRIFRVCLLGSHYRCAVLLFPTVIRGLDNFTIRNWHDHLLKRLIMKSTHRLQKDFQTPWIDVRGTMRRHGQDQSCPSA